MSERDFLRWVRARLGPDPRVLVPSGDDAAVVRAGSDILIKVDAVIDGVHFKKARPEQIGHKAIARPLSDIAAMGCHPAYAVVAMLVPRTARTTFLRRVFLGMNRTAKKFGVAIVGGDLKSHPGKLAITVSIVGETRGLRPILRSGAQPGDRILHTGRLGEDKHLTFTPRIREGLALNEHYDIHAMIDISDGLVLDLSHVCEASGVSAELYEGTKALYSGEDYELLFTAAPEEADRIAKAKLGTIIGEIRAGRGVRMNGELLKIRGWEHEFDR